jgi:hypothetical protein
MHGGLVKLDDFALDLVLATFYVILGGSVLFWVLNWIVNTMDELSQMTLGDVMGTSMLIVIIIVVALII